MNDGDALVRAILANPGEDTPRLVYADWIEENFGHHPRAEFIRVQIELNATLEPGYYNVGGVPGQFWNSTQVVCIQCVEDQKQCRFHELLQREDLLSKMADAYRIPTDSIAHTLPRQVWTRGFLSNPHLTWEDWINKSQFLIENQPVEVVTLLTPPYRALRHGEYSNTNLNRGIAYSNLALAQRWRNLIFHRGYNPDLEPIWDDTWRGM